MGRPKTIIGNWKMHKTLDEAVPFVKQLKSKESNAHVWLAVPYTLIFPLSQEVSGSSLKIGGQNMNDATEGAFTGEIAAKMLIDAGAFFVLLGHSERRRLFHEDSSFINRKVKRALEAGLVPVVCIGETKEERDSGQTGDVIRTQLTEGLSDIPDQKLETLMIAYEPVWAIGHGESATPEAAQEVHQICRETLAELYSPELAQKISILYGGSVNPSNAPDLLHQPDVDGLLIGGASLSLESFSQIVDHIKD